MNKTEIGVRFGASALAIAAVAFAAPMQAHAQTAPATQPEGVLEDIIVTANKTSQNLQDVGISVTAFSGETLRELGYTNATDIVRQTPGLAILSSSASNTNVNIRGISQNDFADHLEGPIAVYADEGYLGAAGALNGQIYDMQRVEVLRGPQGTLFGRNATGGLIHYISAAPTDEFEAYGQLDVGDYNLVQFEGAVSGPLSEGVRARLSVAGVRSDGYVDNLIGPDPANRNNYSARLQVAFDLSAKTELRLMVNGNTTVNERGLAGQSVPAVADANGQGRALGEGEIGSWPNIILGGTVTGACAGCDILGYDQPDDPFKRSYNDPGEFERDLFHAQARLTSELGWANFTSITDYLYLSKSFTDQDVDGGPSQFFRFNTFQGYHQYSQELRLEGESDALKWQTGLYYLNILGDYTSSVEFDVSTYVGAPICGITPGFPCPTPVPGVVGLSQADYTLDVESYAAFAQLEFVLSEQLSLIGGLRYTHDQKDVDYSWTTTAIPFPTPTVYNASTDPAASRVFENISAKLELDWRPTEDTLIYASYSRGHKGGNWALPSFPPPVTSSLFPIFPHREEVLTSYELGLKTEFWDRRARFNVSTFYYDYEDYQAFSLAGLSQSIFNKDAEAWGGEAELVLAPTRSLDISLSAATMESKVPGMQYPAGGLYEAELPFSPSLTLNGMIRYGWDVLGGELAAQTSFTSVSSHYFTVANEPITHEKGYFTADARVSYTTGDGHWNGAIWVKNLTDEEYRVFAIDISTLSLGNQNYAAPRVFGVSLGYRF